MGIEKADLQMEGGTRRGREGWEWIFAMNCWSSFFAFVDVDLCDGSGSESSSSHSLAWKRSFAFFVTCATNKSPRISPGRDPSCGKERCNGFPSSHFRTPSSRGTSSARIGQSVHTLGGFQLESSSPLARDSFRFLTPCLAPALFLSANAL